MKISKILLYGQGNARDHVNHFELSKKNGIEIVSLIRKENALMQEYKNVFLIKGIEDAIDFANEFKPDLVIVSNRYDLVQGVSDRFRKEGFNVFGVSKKAAELENSKKFAKEIMKKYSISTPDYYIANIKEEAIKYLKKNWDKTDNGYVLKVEQYSKCSFDRTAVPSSLEDAISCVHRLYASTPNTKLIIEEKIIGYELSVHVLVDGMNYSIMPMVQDYKKLYPNDEGPMTAGVASVATNKIYTKELLQRIEEEIVKTSLKAFRDEGIEYQSILYIGVIVDEEGKPYILEYNTRSGNPEWLAILGLLNGKMYDIFNMFYNGEMEKISNCWNNDGISIAVYGLSAGYPETVRSSFDECIYGLDEIKSQIEVFAESVKELNGKYLPSGGRVFALRKVGNNFEDIMTSIIKSYDSIKMNGLFFRNDIKLFKN